MSTKVQRLVNATSLQHRFMVVASVKDPVIFFQTIGP